MTLTTRAAAATVRTTFAFDATQNLLSWTLQQTSTTPQHVLAVVLRRASATGIRVITRLAGPGMMRARGSLTLNAVERLALYDGRLSVALYNTANATAPTETRLKLP